MNKEHIEKVFKSRYNREEWKSFLGKAFSNKEIFSQPLPLPGINNSIASEAYKLGSIKLFENGLYRTIDLYEVKLTGGVILERNRVGLRNLLKRFWNQIDGAFIVYYQESSKNWRFTYVSELTGFDPEGILKTNSTDPKRYTYLLGEDESCRTAVDRFTLLLNKVDKVSLDDIKDAFSVEKLSKEFFTSYKLHYSDFCKYLINERSIFQSKFNGDEKSVRDFCKKLLGRIVFLYFIQKKGWLGVPQNGNWGEGDLQFISNLFNNYEYKGSFYQNVLTKLFFDSLNNQRDDDLIELLEGNLIKIPFLNGGLFEEEEVKHRNIIFNQTLFANLFAFFDQYNFTIYEDDPNDQTVAVDPEMLGHIFENLLEDNKDKGAFYTPKEIVHYMCQESLIEYLTTWFEDKGFEIIGHTTFTQPQQPSLFPLNNYTEGQLEFEQPVYNNEKKIDRVIIEKLLKKTLEDSEKDLIVKYFDEFNKALDSVKICDPAIGSGAFPMGLLQEIFSAKQTLHYFYHGNLDKFNPSVVKLNIIEKSIYGVDIEKGAVDIARLRFWLSLVVDEETPKPLPNLDYKIVVGNSLVSKLDEDVVDINWDLDIYQQGIFGNNSTNNIKALLDKLSVKQKEFFTSEKDKKDLSFQIRNLKIDLLIETLNLMIAKNVTLISDFKNKKKTKVTDDTRLIYKKIWESTIQKLEKLKETRDKPLNFFDWKLDFPEVLNEQITEKPGFDIVIGNPPYVQLQKNNGLLAKTFENQGYQTFERTGDIYSLFYEKGIQLLKIKGILTYITSNKWMRAGYGKSTRAYFCNHNPVALIDLGSGVFESATVDTNILLLQKTAEKPKNHYLRALDISKEKSVSNFEIYKSKWMILNQITEDSWVISNEIEQIIKTKIEKIGKPLKDWDVQIYRGILTGYNEAFIIDGKKKDELIAQDPKSAEIIKPVLRGRDIKRYKAEFADLWLINSHNGIKGKLPRIDVVNDYPAVYKHLLQFEDQLIKRQDKGDHWSNLRNCAYIQEFEKEKIVYPNMTLFLPFIIDNKNFYTNQKCFILTSDLINLKYLCGFFNSKVSHRWIRENCPELQGGTRELSKIFFENIPIPSITEAQQKPIILIVEQILAGKEIGQDTTSLEQQIDNLVYRLYDLTYEEVKVIDPDFKLSEEEYKNIKIDEN